VQNHKTTPRSEYDEAWKSLIEAFTADFFDFYFPALYNRIDFTKPVEHKDKELQKIFSKSYHTHKVADKLIAVILKNGKKSILFIHIEVQGTRKKDFAERMLHYYTRIKDRYNHDILSVALLTDGSNKNINNVYQFKFEEFEYKFTFPYKKITDFKDQGELLLTLQNPFALITYSLLEWHTCNKEQQKKLDLKTRLTILLLEKGFSEEYIRVLFNFIDWVIKLPIDIDKKFENTVLNYQEGKKMAYVNTFERLHGAEWMMKGKIEGEINGEKKVLLRLLKIKFFISEHDEDIIQNCNDTSKIEEASDMLILGKEKDEILEVLRNNLQ